MQIASRLDKINQDKMVLLKQRGRFVPACFADQAEVSYFVCFRLFSLSVIFLFRLDALAWEWGGFCLKVSQGILQFQVRVTLDSFINRKKKGAFLAGIFWLFWEIFAIFLQAVSWAPVAALKACVFVFISPTDDRLQGSCFSLVAYSNLPWLGF